jgi:hypothetical protein
MTSFVSVATGAARYQDISLNPQKLAGQCAKLKCCINYEVDTYVEAHKRLPSREIALETLDNTYYHFKTDIFKREITYSTDKVLAANLVTISAGRAFEVINLNKKGIKPESLLEENRQQQPRRDAQDILGQDSVTRFDASLKKKKKKRNGNNRDNTLNNNHNNRNNLPREVVNNQEENNHIHNREDKGNKNGNRSRNNSNGHHMGNGNRSSRPNRINNEKEQPIKSTKNPETKTDA